MKKMKSFSVALVLGLGLAGLFQNCGMVHHEFEDPASVEARDFFAYPYSAKPTFYGELMLFRQESRIADLSEFKVVGVVSYPDDALVAIDYTVRVVDESGAAICPTQTGTLAAGQSLISFDCVSAVVSQKAQVLMTVAAAGLRQDFEKTY